jgi:outer membrane protein TolC
LPLATGGQNSSTEYSMRSLFVLGVDVQWNFDGLGVKQLSQLNTARADARRASLEFTRSLNQVYKDVRDSYLSSLSAANLILETTDMVNYGAEELRVAEVRLKDGVGTNLDVINAQRDYINALVNKANALIQYNTAQTQLMHAIGRSTVDTLTSNVPLHE